MTNLTVNNCELCNADGGVLLWRDPVCRVVAVTDEDYPGFCRVILNRHAAEMTQIEPHERERLMQAVFATEAALRETMHPTKINLASLGNMVAHLHWHVIPRFADDRHFPAAIWAEPRRPRSARTSAARRAPTPEILIAHIESRLG